MNDGFSPENRDLSLIRYLAEKKRSPVKACHPTAIYLSFVPREWARHQREDSTDTAATVAEYKRLRGDIEVNRILTKGVLASAATLVLFAGNAAAAERVDLMKLNPATLKRAQSAMANAAGTAGTAPMTHARHAQMIGLDSESHLVAKSRRTSLGARNSRYKQTFRGVPIFGESVVVSEDAASGEVRALYGRKITGLAGEIPSIKPKLSKAEALAAGKRAALGGRTRVRSETAELNIYVDDSGRASLVYRVQFYADSQKGGNPTLPNLLVDANNGRILKQWENLQHANGTGPGGNDKTGKYEYGTDFGYLNVTQSGSSCTLENDRVKTINLNHLTDLDVDLNGKTAYSYSCPRNTVKPINGAYAPMNDAHYYGNVVFDMYQAYMGEAPIPGKLMLGVHYANQYENASYDRSNNSMVFGDGKDFYYPLVSLDVMSHEVSHGYTNHNSDLLYDMWDSGALNEGFSDMAGEAAEYYMHGTNDFIVGHDIVKGEGKGIRYMDDPKKDGGVSIDHVLQFHKGGMNNHRSSGVYNKAFYLLATTPGWNTKTAFQIFARANRDYWTENTSFNQGASGALRAACDMGLKGQDVIKAFNVVGIDAGQLWTGCGDLAAGKRAPAANFRIAARGQHAELQDTSTDADGTIVSRSWDFGDGTTSTEQNPTKYFHNGPGFYKITLTVKDNDGLSHTRYEYIIIAASQLTHNVPWTDVSGGPTGEQFFRVATKPETNRITITASGGTGARVLYVKRNSTTVSTTNYDCKSSSTSKTLTVTCYYPYDKEATEYRVLLKGNYSGVKLLATYEYPIGYAKYCDQAQCSIPDASGGDFLSTINVPNGNNNDPGGAYIKYGAWATVQFVHPASGDLKVDLISPTGKVYNIHNRTGASADNLTILNMPLNLVGEPKNGNWSLRVNDNKPGDAGWLKYWEVKY
ncbi:M4 family metallopeptidase [Lysobacter sp. CA196]|uniref:M4 family metallopeptidase n=1 Tax=Lysobacter sp. CA196 TaxID=3455606 RepID=UPI003F8D7B44